MLGMWCFSPFLSMYPFPAARLAASKLKAFTQVVCVCVCVVHFAVSQCASWLAKWKCDSVYVGPSFIEEIYLIWKQFETRFEPARRLGQVCGHYWCPL